MRPILSKSSAFYFDDCDEYRNDFKAVVKEREQNRIPFLHQSPQISYRHVLIHYMKKVCISKVLSHSCLHSAIYLLDMFMDNHHIIKDRLLLVANVCLLLAAKLEENSVNVPRISELNALINDKYLPKDYINLEVLILQFFRFSPRFPCAAHYIFYFMQESLNQNEIKENSFRTTLYEIFDSITKYLDRILEDIHYMQCYQPSKLAAAVIAASRFENGLSFWNNRLVDLTDYTLEDIEDIVLSLTRKNILKCSQC